MLDISTIFKTFDTSSTNIKDKTGIFNKSYTNIGRDLSSGQGLGTALFSGSHVTKADIANIQAMDVAMKNGSTTAQAWQKHMTGCTVAAKQQAKQCLLNKGSLSELTAGLQSTTLGAKAATLGLKALSVAGNMLLSMGISMAISAVIGWIQKLANASQEAAEKAEELASKSEEAAQKSTEKYEKLVELVEEYQDIVKQDVWDNSARERAVEIQKEINALTGKELDGLDQKGDKLQENLETLRKIRLEQLKESNTDKYTAYKDKGSAAWTAYNSAMDDEGHFVTFSGGPEKEYTAVKNILLDSGIFELTSDVDGNWQLNLPRAKNFDEMREQKKKIEELLTRLKEAGYGNSYYFKHLSDFLKSNDWSSKTDEWKVSYDSAQEGEAEEAVLQYAQNKDFGEIDTEDEYNAIVEDVKNNKEKWKNDDGDYIGDTVLAYLKDKYGHLVPQEKPDVSGVKENTALSLDALENASSKIADISSAVKQFTDNGYISVDMLKKIQQATGLAGNEWDKYRDKLLNVTPGTKEYNELIDDLTYKTLENTFASVGLKNAREEDIAAVLRSNGVKNSEAMAHQYSIRAKMADKIATTDLTEAIDENGDGIDDNIAALIAEGKQMGLTENQMYNLIASEIMFNNTDLDVSDKVKALNKVMVAALGADAAIDGVMNNSSWEDKKEYAANKGITVVENDNAEWTDDKGNTFHYAAYTVDGYGTFDSIEEAALNAGYKKLTETIPNEFPPIEFGDGKSSSSSDKNDALSDYLEEAERRYKIHQDETRYINELNYALSNLVKTEEERRDLLDKIEQARKDYADNQIKDIEHLIELEKNLHGEENSSTIRDRLNNLGNGGNVNLLLRPQVDTSELNAKGWNAGEGFDIYINIAFQSKTYRRNLCSLLS